MTQDVAAIARGLSAGQALGLRMWPKHETHILGGYGLKWVHAHLVEAVGINHPIFGSHYRLTPLGLAVRQHLTEQEGRS